MTERVLLFSYQPLISHKVSSEECWICVDKVPTTHCSGRVQRHTDDIIRTRPYAHIANRKAEGDETRNVDRMISASACLFTQFLTVDRYQIDLHWLRTQTDPTPSPIASLVSVDLKRIRLAPLELWGTWWVTFLFKNRGSISWSYRIVVVYCFRINI